MNKERDTRYKENRIIPEFMPRAYFNRGYAEIMMHLTNHPDLNIPGNKVTSNGFPLGKWLKEVRTGLKQNAFDARKTAMLEALGISCEKKYQSWESMYLKALDYYTRNRTIEVPVGYCTEDGVLLGAWIDRQRRYYEALQKGQKEKLNKLGIRPATIEELCKERR